MIREPAARELAQSILGPYVKRGFATESQVELAATIIRLAVDADETRQQIEAMEKAPA